MCFDLPKQSILSSVEQNAIKRENLDNSSSFRMAPKSLDTRGNMECQVLFEPLHMPQYIDIWIIQKPGFSFCSEGDALKGNLNTQ